MKLDIELLNRLKEEVAENNGVSWYDFTPSRHERNWEEVCLRYSEEVNKKPDTKTAEDNHVSSLNKRIERLERQTNAYKDYINSLPNITSNSSKEYASPLKKRIEELEDLLNSVQGILENEGYVTKVAEIERAINHSTNGK